MDEQTIAVGLTSYFVLLFSLSFHESAHAWMALQMGDDTALREGRITLNPLAHIDPIGTVLIPIIQIFGPGIPLLGWAKPTPVQPRNFTHLRKGYLLVWGAGPVSNFLLALVFTALLYVAVRVGVATEVHDAVFSTLVIGVSMNIALGVFNLIPLPPLDGSFVFSWALPRSLGNRFDSVMQPYGNIILLVLFVTGILGRIVGPFVAVIRDLLFYMVF
jgi:Zn-dependent protease